MEYYWWEKMITLPVRGLCRRLVARLGFRKSGLLMLSREVQACEYEDVQIMWEMLKKSETPEVSRSSTQLKNRGVRKVFTWARFATCLSNKF